MHAHDTVQNPAPASPPMAGQAIVMPATSSVTLACTGEQYPCRHDESLLHGMLRLGRKGIPAGCTNGGCGVCKVHVTCGQVHRIGVISRAHVSVEEEAAGYTLACRTAPDTDVTLDVVGRVRRNVMRSVVGGGNATTSESAR